MPEASQELDLARKKQLSPAFAVPERSMFTPCSSCHYHYYTRPQHHHYYHNNTSTTASFDYYSLCSSALNTTIKTYHCRLHHNTVVEIQVGSNQNNVSVVTVSCIPVVSGVSLFS